VALWLDRIERSNDLELPGFFSCETHCLTSPPWNKHTGDDRKTCICLVRYADQEKPDRNDQGRRSNREGHRGAKAWRHNRGNGFELIATAVELAIGKLLIPSTSL